MTNINPEKQAKDRFVREELASMLSVATNGFVCECAYECFGDDEFVHVYAKPDGRTTVRFDVNISCDSTWAIAKDVMRAVAEKYE